MRKALMLAASVIVFISVIILVLILSGAYRVPFFFVDFLGISYSAVHWIGWIGAVYVAIATPLYSIVKRRYSKYTRKMLNVHIIGNLLAVMLVSIHFANNITRPGIDYMDLGTGTLLYLSMVLLVATGMALITGVGKRYNKQIRFFHPAFAITFYLVVVMHIIQEL